MTTQPGCRLDDLDAQLLCHPLGVLNLTVRASNCLSGVCTIDALLSLSEIELIQTRNFGRTSLLDVRRKLVHFCIDHLALAPGHPIRLALYDPHPALKLVWEAPPQERPLRLVVGDILDCLGRAEEVRETGTWSPSPTAVGPPKRCDYETASLAEICEAFFHCLKERERQIVELRYGPLDSPGATLAEVGQSLGLTRERVRQIVQGCIARLDREEERRRREPFSGAIRGFVAERGDVVQEADVAHFLINRFPTPHADVGPLVRVFLEVEPDYAPVGQGVWVAGPHSPRLVLEVQDGFHSLLRAAGERLPGEMLLTRLRRTSPTAAAAPEPFLRACLRTDDRLAADEEGRYGLVEWQWLLPRSLDDYVYLALRAAGRPRHYMWITQQVNALVPDGDEVTPRDVHGTLLDRSDLFLRYREGTYSLREWQEAQTADGAGLRVQVADRDAFDREPPTVNPEPFSTLSDVVSSILREHGRPMTLDEIVSQIGKDSGASALTVAAFLESANEGTHEGRPYQRTPDGRYGLSDWSRRRVGSSVSAEAVS